ncbi:hypothetical protein DSL64_21695 [Dyadobacter luteus]|uniref:Uncharacterized protein n=1 Tax=Dyadobacter luteus TaxID=2259619 RepID=A0A3D8Y674_9BACT|nr:hypothetical protein [Dyadobacter luteus]REA58223.1 hypothetical protein DSL64_21695 [Dyadobacter luteus]
MKEVLEYYLNNCRQAMTYQNELSFEFGNDYAISFSFDINEEENDDDLDDEHYSYNSICALPDLELFLGKGRKFTTVTIKGYEYLGWREDLSEGKSITNEMYSLVKKINSFDTRAILEYHVTVDYGEAMCDVEGNYLFAIQIAEEFWGNDEFAKFIIENSECTVSVPDFYTVFFRNRIEIKDNRAVSILSTNTKVRRLGYFKVLSLLLKENKSVPAASINRKFENYCLKYKGFLESNQFNKGLINTTKTGISAKPYIDTACDLEFLNRINNAFYSGKTFKVYQTLQTEFSDLDNIFSLSDFDKIFFLEHILRNDYFYFSCVLELMFIEERTTYSHLNKVFQHKIVSRLERYRQSSEFGDRKVLSNLDIILNRIKGWKKADIYLEHVIMPRLNWMLDLNVISRINNEYAITEIGKKIFRHLCIWNDVNTNEIVSANGFLDRFMVHLFDDCYNDSGAINPDKESLILEKMHRYIGESFDFFKTLAPNRVTASQAANYTKYKLYLDDRIKVGYQYILDKLSDKDEEKFIFKFQEQYQDGYIQKIY